MVKDDKHRTNGLVSPNGRVDIDKSGEVFMLLTNIQDEMHRRAITYHRKLRDGSALKSELHRIKGIGDKKAKILLRTFRSMKAVKEATLEEIEAVNGIDKTSAYNVYTYFNGK